MIRFAALVVVFIILCCPKNTSFSISSPCQKNHKYNENKDYDNILDSSNDKTKTLIVKTKKTVKTIIQKIFISDISSET